MHFFVDESKIDFEVGLHILIDFFLLSPFSPFPLPEMILKKKKKNFTCVTFIKVSWFYFHREMILPY